MADILQAASTVLAREGARKFTSARVAEAAGVSVGSLYQYFPNKEAILFRLQVDEWQETGDLLGKLLSDISESPFERLRLTIHAFFRSECEEAALRVALDDAAPLHRDAPESKKHRRSSDQYMIPFVKEVLPEATPKRQKIVADLIMMTMSSLGKTISGQGREMAEVHDVADQVADMLCTYLVQLKNSV